MAIPFLRAPLAAALLAVLLPAAPVAAQRGPDAADILRRAVRSADAARGPRVRDYTVTQTFMGVPNAFYFSRQTLEGVKLWVPQGVQGAEPNPVADIGVLDGSVMGAAVEAMMRTVPEAFRYEGVDSAAGLPAYRLVTTQARVEAAAGAVTAPGLVGGGAAEIELWVDTASYRMLGLRLTGLEMEDEEVPITGARLEFHDFRTTDGVTLPHRTTVELEGMVFPLSEAEMSVLKTLLTENPGALREILAQNADPDPAAALFMEWFLENGAEYFRTGRMVFESRVSEVRVNAGAPDGVRAGNLFDQAMGAGSRP